MVSHERDRLDQAFAFLGNSLLAPLSQTGQMGLDEGFWRTFPSFESSEVRAALDRMARIVRRVALSDDAVCEVSVEFTHLFVGPPRPAAAPWETAYRTGGHVGFGTATVDMQQRLERLKLKVSNENRQYADHVGLELLYLKNAPKKRRPLLPRWGSGSPRCANGSLMRRLAATTRESRTSRSRCSHASSACLIPGLGAGDATYLHCS